MVFCYSAMSRRIYLLWTVSLPMARFAIGSQNDAVVPVNYLIAQADLRISTLIAASLALGVVIGVLMMLVSWLGLRVQLVAARSRVKKLTKE